LAFRISRQYANLFRQSMVKLMLIISSYKIIPQAMHLTFTILITCTFFCVTISVLKAFKLWIITNMSCQCGGFVLPRSYDAFFSVLCSVMSRTQIQYLIELINHHSVHVHINIYSLVCSHTHLVQPVQCQ
jgi:hypothetical protein